MAANLVFLNYVQSAMLVIPISTAGVWSRLSCQNKHQILKKWLIARQLIPFNVSKYRDVNGFYRRLHFYALT